MASAGQVATLELPTFKGRAGWEFTDISGLDLAAYEPLGEEEAGAIVAEPLFALSDAGASLPDGVIVTSMSRRWSSTRS